MDTIKITISVNELSQYQFAIICATQYSHFWSPCLILVKCNLFV